MEAALKRTVYVGRAGATVGRHGELLVARYRRTELARVRVDEVSQLVLTGPVNLTPQAIALLASAGVPAIFLSSRGEYRATLAAPGGGAAELRARQYAFLGDSQRALDLARAFVLGKLANQRALLRRHQRRHGAHAEIETSLQSIRAAEWRSRRAAALDELRGCEGSAAAAYFRAFSVVIRRPDLPWTGRTRRPPRDPINALLSFGYTLLEGVVTGALRVVGLDADFGALHAPAPGRPALSCDLMEELRPPLVDALVIAAVNRDMFHPIDFEPQPDGGVHLSPPARDELIGAFERRLSDVVLYEPLGIRLSWRLVAEHQARLLARAIRGDGPGYSSFVVR